MQLVIGQGQRKGHELLGRLDGVLGIRAGLLDDIRGGRGGVLVGRGQVRLGGAGELVLLGLVLLLVLGLLVDTVVLAALLVLLLGLVLAALLLLLVLLELVDLVDGLVAGTHGGEELRGEGVGRCGFLGSPIGAVGEMSARQVERIGA